MPLTTALRPFLKVKSDLALTVKHQPASPQKLERLRQANASSGAGTKDPDACPGYGRTQLDAMAEAIAGGKFRATKLALLMLVRYWPQAGLGALAVTLLCKMLGHH